MREYIEITPKVYDQIFTSEPFRNSVAHAHKCCDANGKFKYFGTCTYPQRYIVTEGQIHEAKSLKAKAELNTRMEAFDKGFIIFVGMGHDYINEDEPDDIGNHRVRSSFFNIDANQYFLEVGKGNDNKMHIIHSIDSTLELKMGIEAELKYGAYRAIKDTGAKPKYPELIKASKELEIARRQIYYNYLKLEGSGFFPYTKTELLKLVNSKFNCIFKGIVIDNYNVSADKCINQSPKNNFKLNLQL